MVLATDGTKSFVLFIYGDVTWGKAGIGFDAGDGVRSYMLPGSLDESTQEVEESSNVGVEGVYMYRVDQKEIINPGGQCVIVGKCKGLKSHNYPGFIQEALGYTGKEPSSPPTILATVLAM